LTSPQLNESGKFETSVYVCGKGLLKLFGKVCNFLYSGKYGPNILLLKPVVA